MLKPRVEIKRVYLETETLGSLYIDGEFICKTMELPWKDNKRAVSCIPEGTYKVVKQPAKESRPYPYFRLPNVEKRSGILIHKITYVKDLKGCIGVGMSFKDFNKDQVPDMAESTKALALMMALLPNDFDLIITKK